MSPERDTPKMKCLLLLLGFHLVSSDKLDRNYLPPVGAKYSGGSPDELQAPLENQNSIYSGTTQNGQVPDIFQENTLKETPINQDLDTGILKSTFPVDYSTLTYDFDQKNSFPTSGYDSTVATLRPDISSYDSFPPKLPNFSYLPSVQSTSYIVPTSSPSIETSTRIDNDETGLSVKAPGYYYYVPAPQTYENNFANQGLYKAESIDIPHSEFIQYPNQVSDGFRPRNEQLFIPRKATTDDIAQNYQPNSFGYYGGNPMIMSSQIPSSQKIDSVEIASKFGESEINLPTMPGNEDKQNDIGRTSVRPFQTPLVRTNPKNKFQPADSNISSSLSNYTDQPIIKSFSEKKSPIEFSQKRRGPVRPRFRPERPQTESDRNAVVLKYENLITPEGFSYGFDTSNGIHAEESGTAINGVKAKGSYSYTGDDGKIYTVTYTADENGFQPRGDHLPTPPPVPEAIKKVIEKADRNRAAGIVDDGSYDEKKYGHMNYQGAMERYRPLKNSEFRKVNRRIGNNIPRPNTSGRRLASNTGKNYNKETINSDDISITSDSQQVNKHSPNQENKGFDVNIIRTRTESGLKRINQTEGQHNYHSKSNASINSYNKIKNSKKLNDIFFQRQDSNIKDKIVNTDTGFSNNDIQDNSNRITKYKPGDTSGGTLTNDGYYYLPPLIKFNPIPERPAYKKNANITNNKITQQKDVGVNLNQQTIEKRVLSTQTPQSEDTITESTRKPYISGPKDRSRKYYDDDIILQTKSPFENSRNQITTYANDLDTSMYGFTTTPMPSQKREYENQPIDGYLNQYYQTTISPDAIEQTLPSFENRENINSGTHGIRVSQDFVTTTYRPATFKDGVLEVNQNVKIYGLGRPETAVASRGFPDKISTYSDGFYIPNTSNEELNFFGSYPDRFFGRPVQNTNIVQENTVPDTTYGSEFTKEGPVVNSGTTSPYNNVEFGRKFNGVTDGYPKSQSFTSNNYVDTKLSPGQEPTAPTIITQNQSPTEDIIGEDFSGPNQSQRFDPETGYYYK